MPSIARRPANSSTRMPSPQPASSTRADGGAVVQPSPDRFELCDVGGVIVPVRIRGPVVIAARGVFAPAQDRRTDRHDRADSTVTTRTAGPRRSRLAISGTRGPDIRRLRAVRGLALSLRARRRRQHAGTRCGHDGRLLARLLGGAFGNGGPGWVTIGCCVGPADPSVRLRRRPVAAAASAAPCCRVLDRTAVAAEPQRRPQAHDSIGRIMTRSNCDAFASSVGRCAAI